MILLLRFLQDEIWNNNLRMNLILLNFHLHILMYANDQYVFLIMLLINQLFQLKNLFHLHEHNTHNTHTQNKQMNEQINK